MDVIIMNVQGYWDGYDKFVCKELAAASLDGTFVCHYMFENPYPSPYPGKIKLDHELQLINGDVPYNKLLELMTRIVGRARSIMVHERRMIAQLRDITEINVPIEKMDAVTLLQQDVERLLAMMKEQSETNANSRPLLLAHRRLPAAHQQPAIKSPNVHPPATQPLINRVKRSLPPDFDDQPIAKKVAKNQPMDLTTLKTEDQLSDENVIRPPPLDFQTLLDELDIFEPELDIFEPEVIPEIKKKPAMEMRPKPILLRATTYDLSSTGLKLVAVGNEWAPDFPVQIILEKLDKPNVFLRLTVAQWNALKEYFGVIEAYLNGEIVGSIKDAAVGGITMKLKKMFDNPSLVLQAVDGNNFCMQRPLFEKLTASTKLLDLNIQRAVQLQTHLQQLSRGEILGAEDDTVTQELVYFNTIHSVPINKHSYSGQKKNHSN